MKTMAVRLDDELHLQLTVVAQLSGTTVTDAIRQAVHDYIAKLSTDGELATKAQTALQDMEQDLAKRRNAIAALFGPPATP